MNALPDLTQLLVAARSGDGPDRDALYAAVYDRLREIARSQRRRHASDSTLHTTALVHESYLKLCDHDRLLEGDRLRFFAAAARAMRHILVDHFRNRRARKRGGDRVHVTLATEGVGDDAQGGLLLDLDEALRHLERSDERQARVVELRFFVGLRDDEIAGLLGVSDRTVRNEWTRAKAWLADFLADGSGDERA